MKEARLLGVSDMLYLKIYKVISGDANVTK
jgi:hypothetical protein